MPLKKINFIDAGSKEAGIQITQGDALINLTTRQALALAKVIIAKFL